MYHKLRSFVDISGGDGGSGWYLKISVPVVVDSFQKDVNHNKKEAECQLVIVVNSFVVVDSFQNEVNHNFFRMNRIGVPVVHPFQKEVNHNL